MAKAFILTILVLIATTFLIWAVVHLVYVASCYFDADRMNARKAKRDADDALYDLERAARKAKKK